VNQDAFTQSTIVYSVEPSPTQVLRVLIPQLIQTMLYHALLESKASEHSARMVAMKNATDKARDLTKSLRIIYNKERQASITAEVSEITGGIEAMKN
jgi:F-type H+-transporting ATPase subunit gamma